ncbi:GntR family transcriptional regulator [Vineibacter terrae]|uniref:GntR family transcriptional regulator n=1 Tax=Vineibacter terrae TaxID=2586908 RepID=UPI002E31E23D|nr:GntR family transcriptional regulator [Vineibacter terrae]HEX2891969.1 GntR family transcriptional regulator [Vineibacter terrae]
MARKTARHSSAKTKPRKGAPPRLPAEPRYVTVANALMAAIAAGRHPVGSTLPTEHELCERYGISRFTAREALRQLRDAGLVTRRPRAGTTVVATQRRVPYTQTLGSLDALLQYATDTELRLVYTGTIEVDRALAREIPLGLGQRWLFGIGIRYRRDDEVPVCLTRVYVNPDFDDVARRLSNRADAIYKLIEEHHGVSVARVEQRIFAVPLGRDEALHLKAKASGPALRTLRLYYDSDDRLLEVSDSIHPGERFSYAMTINRSG